jgi:hypothetical protein
MAEMCTICRDDVEDNDPVREVTPCGHTFHTPCLDGFRATNTCPNCRGELVANQGQQGVNFDWGQYDPVQQNAPVALGQAPCHYDPPVEGMGPGCEGALRTSYRLGDFVAAQYGTDYVCVVCMGELDLDADLYLAECEHYSHTACAV